MEITRDASFVSILFDEKEGGKGGKSGLVHNWHDFGQLWIAVQMVHNGGGLSRQTATST